MRKPRVLIAGPVPPPVGGVETVTQALLESPALAAFAVAHCDLTKGRPKETQGRFDFGNVRWALIHVGRMYRCIRQFRPDVVYMALSMRWSGLCRDLALAGVARLGGARVVGHVHGRNLLKATATRGVVAWLMRRCLRWFDAILVLIPAWVKPLANFGYRGDVHVVPSTLRREVIDAGARFTRRYESDSPMGLFVGHVGRRKGIGDLLDALKRLKDAGQPARVTIVGPPQYQGEREAIAEHQRTLGLADDVVVFKGPLQGDALYEEYRRADYFVLPSHSEGMPVVLFEAGAFGLPVIAADVGGVPLFVHHDRNGLLVTPRDVDGLVEAIQRLHVSAVDRARLGKQLRGDIRQYDPDAVCARIAGILFDLFKRRGNGAVAVAPERAPSEPKRAAH